MTTPNDDNNQTSRIAILPPELADQIAAGEVVERAASAVKELCENAIDAGATRIDVEIEGGGRRLIRVVDDGCGMTPGEARLSLKRHATSKITSADDLWRLTSFGFRGEALPSIAAVSRLTLSTKVRGAAVGFRVEMAVGAEVNAGDIGIPEGTQVEVRDLFANTPARLKFQKTDATESTNAQEAVLRLALSHPEIHFRLRLSGRLALDLPVHRELAERVRAALARRGLGALHEVQGEEAGHRVRAFLASPDQAASTARSTYLFVGRRYVRDRAMLHALGMGYGGLLDKGRYPMAVLFLEVPGAELDVNVHPQKLEVRFARPAEVSAAIRHVVGQGVTRAPWFAEAQGRVRVHSLPPAALTARGSWGAYSPAGGWEPASRSPPPATGSPRLAEAPLPAVGPPGVAPSRAEPAEETAVDRGAGLAGGLRYVGTVDQAFWICETERTVMLLDPHTVHEQILLRQLEEAHERGPMRSQGLLFPIPIELPPGLAIDGPTTLATLREIGVEAEFSGSSSGGRSNAVLLVRALPEVVAHAPAKPVLTGLLEVLAAGGPGAPADRRSRPSAEVLPALLSVLACEGSVRAGEAPSRARSLELLSQVRLPLDGPVEDRLVDRRSAGSIGAPSGSSPAEFSCRRGRRLCWLLALADLRLHFGST